MFSLKTSFPKLLHQVWFISFSVDYVQSVRHLVIKSGEQIGISPLTNKRVQPRKDSTVCHHLLN